MLPWLMESSFNTTQLVKASAANAAPERTKAVAIARSSHVFVPVAMPLHAPKLNNSDNTRKTTEKAFNEFLVR